MGTRQERTPLPWGPSAATSQVIRALQRPCSPPPPCQQTGSALVRAGQTSESEPGPAADYVKRPPVEAVVFGWGVAEDGQLVSP